MTTYEEFLKAKTVAADEFGFDVDPSEVNPLLKPHQRDIVCWAVRRGRAALFEAFGLGKTMQQLEIVRLTLLKISTSFPRPRGLIVIPLGVRQEFMRDAETLGIEVTFVRTTAEAQLAGIYLTNYESVREGKVDPREFDVVSLDEAGILRGFGGTKTFREAMATMAGDDRRDLSNVKRGEGIPYRFVATATPSPNEFIELLAYSAFLGVMDVSAAKTRFFKRNSEKADALTHLCPLQFDIVDRVIRQMSNPGEVVFDPFSGLGTVALRAVKLGRKGLGCELSAGYHADALYWLRRQDREVAMPSLFDALEAEMEVAS